MASTVSVTTDQAKTIASQTADEGKKSLAKVLGWQAFDAEDDMRRDILLDYLYDNFMFAVGKGFPWSQAVLCMELAAEMQRECQGMPLVEAIKHYSTRSQPYAQRLGDRNFKMFTDQFFQSYMQHYQLYQYVFGRDRDGWVSQYDLSVEPPPEPMLFKEGKSFKQWDYERQVVELQTMEAERRKLREVQKQNLEEEGDKLIQEAFTKLEGIEGPVDKETLASVVGDSITAHVTVTRDKLRTSIEEVQDSLEFKLEKNKIPKPQGAKTPTPPVSGKRRKSPDRPSTRGSSTSARGKKK
ncbi:hypothetical protein Bbelb_206790 [Branchiostoma belcheri]|nr:hypothetical protein Bbelb_206790 [Branchiostoma belcheri]